MHPNPLIVDAIEQRRRLSFVYGGKPRIAEPQCYGVGHTGNELLRVYQVQGGSQPEPLFNVEKIERLVMLAETFRHPGPNYKRDDSAMRLIYAQL
ncbi:MAG: hypothetical protein JSR59_13975 [Proteobacteria bacterium]|nr:hypothetical protein [Pseudomonadota bacterium]